MDQDTDYVMTTDHSQFHSGSGQSGVVTVVITAPLEQPLEQSRPWSILISYRGRNTSLLKDALYDGSVSVSHDENIIFTDMHHQKVASRFHAYKDKFWPFKETRHKTRFRMTVRKDLIVPLDEMYVADEDLVDAKSAELQDRIAPLATAFREVRTLYAPESDEYIKAEKDLEEAKHALDTYLSKKRLEKQVQMLKISCVCSIS